MTWSIVAKDHETGFLGVMVATCDLGVGGICPLGSVAKLCAPVLLRYDCGWSATERSTVVEFKGSHFEREIILWGVRWYVAYPISYRQLEEVM